jgi:hypothetical protein
MTARKKPETPEEQWQALVDFGRGAEERDLAEMTDEEAKAVLEAYGYDLAKVDRDGEAFFSKLFERTAEDEAIAPPASASTPDLAHASDVAPPSSAGAPVVSLQSRRQRFFDTVPYYAAAAGVVAAILGQSVGRFGPPQLADPNHPDHMTPAPEGPTPPDLVARAKALREQAAGQCQAKQWEKCRATLDEALKLDESGELGFEVQAMRKQINDWVVADDWAKSRKMPNR